LQFHRGFSFRQASEDPGYLGSVGITDAYASPLLTARSGSLRGYDVIDFGRINPELGSAEEFAASSHQLKSRGIGRSSEISC
jgi:(1->4)-alpha-D-glucan 1-alpha-D-glucosylmutase